MEYFAGDMNKFVAFGKEFFGEQVFAAIVRNPDTKAQLLQVAKILNGLEARFGGNKKQSSKESDDMGYRKLNVIASKEYIAGSYNRLMDNMNKRVVCLISAWREHRYEYKNNKLSEDTLPGKETKELASHNENQKRAKILEKLLHDAGLQFNKCKGGYREQNSSRPVKEGEEVKPENLDERITEYSYAVVNTQFNDEDFINRMVELGTLFDQDTILITTPTNEGNPNKAANVTGDYYITSTRLGKIGDIDMHFDELKPSAVSEYFTKVFGKTFTLTSVAALEEPLKPARTGANARLLKSALFNKLYPHLALKRKYYRNNPNAIPTELRKYIK